MSRAKNFLKLGWGPSILGLCAFGVISTSAHAQNPAPVQLNPALQSLGFFGTGYYGGNAGANSYYYPRAGYTPPYPAPNWSRYPYTQQFYTPYRRPCAPHAARPLTTMVPTDLTRHPPRFANPWFTSPGYRSRQGFSGR